MKKIGNSRYTKTAHIKDLEYQPTKTLSAALLVGCAVLGGTLVTSPLNANADEYTGQTSGIYSLTNSTVTIKPSELTLTGNLSITGNDNTKAIITAEGSRKFIKDLSGHNLTLESLTLKEFYSNSSGGVLSTGTTSNSSITIKNSIFSNYSVTNTNTSSNNNNGGAIFNAANATINSIKNSTFEKGGTYSSYAGRAYYGGTIYNEGIVDSISGTVFQSNYSRMNGGAISNGTTSSVIKSIDSSTSFTNNTSQYGAALYNNGTIGDYSDADNPVGGISNVNFSQNSATVNGGAIFNESNAKISSITESQFSQNSATSNGGAIFNKANAIIDEISNTTFNENSANGLGGAILNRGTIKSIEGSIFTSNTAGTNGGAIYNDATGSITFNGTNTIQAGTGTSSNNVYNAGTINNSGNLNIYSDFTNTGTINLNSGNLTSTIAGSGGTINANGGSLSSQNKKIAASYLGTLTLNSDLNLGIDVDASSSKADTFSISSFTSNSHNLVLDSINRLDTTTITTPITVNVLASSGATLTLGDSLKDKTIADYYDSIEEKYIATNESFVGNSGISIATNGLDVIIGQASQENTLKALNVYTNGSDATNRVFNFITPETGDVVDYTIGSNLGTTSKGTMTVNGYDDDATHSVINLTKQGTDTSNYSGFVLGSDATLTIDAVSINNANSSSGGAINNNGILKVGETTKSIFENNAAKWGGAIINTSTSDENYINADFIGNSATGHTNAHSGAILNDPDGKITSILGSFIGNSSNTFAGAIGNKGTIGTIQATFGDGTDTGKNTAGTDGGAIYNSNEGIISNILSTFNLNSATNNGGAITNHGTITDIGTTTKSATFTSNFATNGGAIYNDEGTIDSIVADFTSNGINGTTVTTTNGGAIYNNSGSISNITSSNFTSNSVTSNGGAIYTKGKIDSITDTSFGSSTESTKGNSAANGGAIYLDGGSITTLSAGFYNNSATTNGGAIYNKGTITNLGTDSAQAIFNSNSAINGGAIYNASGVKISSIIGSFTSNTATNGIGGAIYNAGEISSIGSTTKVSTFTSNTSTSSSTSNNGGAIANTGTIGAIIADFASNQANNKNGGAIYNANTGTITNIGSSSVKTTISNNSAAWGGAITNHGTIGTYDDKTGVVSGGITNVTFDSNSAYEAGAIFNNGKIAISNSTFINNYVTETTIPFSGGALQNEGIMFLGDGNTFSNNTINYTDGTNVKNDIRNTKTLTITGSNSFDGGIDGTGDTIIDIASGKSVTVSGTGSSTTSITQSTLTTQGSGNLLVKDLSIISAVTNKITEGTAVAIFENTPITGTFTNDKDAHAQITGLTSVTGQVTNNGNLEILNGTNDFEIQTGVTGDETIENNLFNIGDSTTDGTVTIKANKTIEKQSININNGKLTVAATNAKIDDSYITIANNAELDNSGIVTTTQLTNNGIISDSDGCGDLILSGNATNNNSITQANIELTSGTFTNNSDANVESTNSLYIEKGTELGNSGTVTASNLTNKGTILDSEQSGTLKLSGVSENAGEITQSVVENTGILNNASNLTTTSSLTNDGVINNNAGATIDAGTIINNGTINMNGSTIIANTQSNYLNGTINVNEGTNELTILSKKETNNIEGTVHIKNAAVLDFNAGNITMTEGHDATVDIEKGATMNILSTSGTPASIENEKIDAVGVVYLNGNDNWDGDINIKGGILTLANDTYLTSNKSTTSTNNTSYLTMESGVLGLTNSTLAMADSSLISGGDIMLDSKATYYSLSNGFNVDTLLTGGLVNTINNGYENYNMSKGILVGSNNDHQADFAIDIFAKSSANHKTDRFNAGAIMPSFSGDKAIINISDWALHGDLNGKDAPTEKSINLGKIFNSNNISKNITFTASDKEVLTPIAYYKLQPNAGQPGAYSLNMTRFNPQVFRGQVSTLAMYNNQINIDDILTNRFMLPDATLANQMTNTSYYNPNRYAINDTNIPYQGYSAERGGLWFKSYVDFETLTFNNGLSTHNTVYGSVVGADFPMINMKRGWKFIPTAFIAYNGANQDFSGVSMYQNGGQGGLMGTFLKNDFRASVLAYGGGYNNEMQVAGNTDHTGNWFAGAASRFAYNFHPTKHFTIQPTAFISYNIFGTQHWGTDFGAMSMNSGLLNGINVAPGVNFIYARETWSVYAALQYMYNINDHVGGQAGNIQLESMAMRHGYFQYGIGATKTWKDTINGYIQVMLRNGGRTGIGFQLGFRWALGKEGKPIEKVQNTQPTVIKESTKTNKQISSNTLKLNITTPEELANKNNTTLQTTNNKVVLKQLSTNQRTALQGKRTNTKLTFYAEY